MNKIAELRREIEALEIQKSAKEKELRQLQDAPTSLLGLGASTAIRSTNLRSEEKVALFLDLFGARRDVYAKYWENPGVGTKGYSPAYAYSRGPDAFGRHPIPLEERVAEGHLRGSQEIPVRSCQRRRKLQVHNYASNR
jgi:hypothetical protein